MCSGFETFNLYLIYARHTTNFIDADTHYAINNGTLTFRNSKLKTHDTSTYH